MIFNNREVTQENVDFANMIAMMVLVFGALNDMEDKQEQVQWFLDQCGGDEWLSDFAAFVTHVAHLQMETGCTQTEAMAKFAQEGA
jgi:hypothetical protein